MKAKAMLNLARKQLVESTKPKRPLTKGQSNMLEMIPQGQEIRKTFNARKWADALASATRMDQPVALAAAAVAAQQAMLDDIEFELAARARVQDEGGDTASFAASVPALGKAGEDALEKAAGLRSLISMDSED